MLKCILRICQFISGPIGPVIFVFVNTTTELHYNLISYLNYNSVTYLVIPKCIVFEVNCILLVFVLNVAVGLKQQNYRG